METDRQVRNLIEEVKSGVFKPVYLLMGEEPYYPDILLVTLSRLIKPR